MTDPTDGPTSLRPLAGLIGVPAGEMCGPDVCTPVTRPATGGDDGSGGPVPQDGTE